MPFYTNIMKHKSQKVKQLLILRWGEEKNPISHKHLQQPEGRYNTKIEKPPSHPQRFIFKNNIQIFYEPTAQSNSTWLQAKNKCIEEI